MMGRLACMEQSEHGKRSEDSRYFPAYQGRHSSLYPCTTSGIPLQNQNPTDASLPRIVGFDPRSHLPEGQRCVSSFAEIPSLEPRARSSYRESSFSPPCVSEVKEVRSSAVSPNLKLPPILSTKSSSAPDAISMPPNNILPMAPMISRPGYQEDYNKSSLMEMKLAYENMMVSYFMPQTVKSENAPIADKQLTGQIPTEQNEAYVACGYVGSYPCHPLTSMNELVKNCPCDEDYCVLQNITPDSSFSKGHQKLTSENKPDESIKQFIRSTCGKQLTMPQSNVNHHTAMDVTSSGCTMLDRGSITPYQHTSSSSTNGGQVLPERKCSDSSIIVATESSNVIPSSEAQTSMSTNEDQTSTSTDVSVVLNELSLLMPPQDSETLSGVYQAINITTSFSSATTASYVNTTSSVKNSVSNFQYQNRSDSTWGRFSVLPPVMSSATPLGGCQHDGDNISVLSYNAFPNNAQNSPQMGMYYTPFSVNFPDNISSALASSPRYSGRSSYSGKGSRNKRALSNSPLSAEGIDLNSIIRMSPTSLIAYINGSRSSSSCVSPGSAGDRTGCYGHLSARNSSSSPNSGSNSSSNRRSTSYTPQTATPGMSNSRSNPSNVASDNSNVSEVCCSNENIKNDFMTIDENLLVMQAMQELEAGAAMAGNGNTGFSFCSNIMHPAQMIPESENLQVLPQDIAAFTTEDFIPFIPSVLPPAHTHLQSHYQTAPSPTLQTVSQKHNKPPPTYDQHMARKATLQKNSSSESSQPSNSSSFESSEGDKTVAGSSTDTETNRMYACRWLDCTAVFQDQDEFVTHIEKVHIDQKKGDEFICYWKLCPRRLHPFNARYKLLVHMRVHSGDKPNKCTYAGCKKAFSRLENLKIHLRSHTGERPYSCTHLGCTKTFSNSSDRTKHQKTHHDTKPYVCQVAGCGKRYTDPSSLRKHVKKSHPDKKEPDRKKIRGVSEEMDPKDLNECLMIQAIKPITLCDASPPEPTDSGLGRSPRSSQPGSSSDHYPGIIYTGEAAGRSETAQGSSCHTSPSSHHSSPPAQIERDKLPANNNSLRVPVLPPITPVPPQMQSLGIHIQGHVSKMRSSPNVPSVRPRELDARGSTNLLQDRLLSQDALHHVTGIYSSCSVRSADLSTPSILNPPSRYEKEHS